MRPLALAVTAVTAVAVSPNFAHAIDPGERLRAAYPEFVAGVEGNDLVLKGGRRLVISDGRTKSAAERLDRPDLADMFVDTYPSGPVTAPARDVDPGRHRPAAFFDALYGDCRKGEVEPHLVAVAWVPKHGGGTVMFSARAGAAAALAAASRELDAGPAEWRKYLVPAAGTYNCRVIAGTDRISAHGRGIAIDIATGASDYWYWSDPKGANVTFRNRIPAEIGAVFERHGFVWGARWYHHDTMHFEYRPEILGIDRRK
jgi:hypothetical protein